MSNKENNPQESEQIIALKNKLTELMNENSKLKRLSENVVREINADFAYALQELHELVETVKKESNIDAIKSYVTLYQAALWDRVANLLGFEGIEDLASKGFSVDLVVTPTIQMSYRPSSDLEQPANLQVPPPPTPKAN